MSKLTSLSTVLVVLAMAACASDQQPTEQVTSVEAPTMVVEELDVDIEADIYSDPVADIYGDAPFVEDSVLVEFGSADEGDGKTRLVSSSDGALPPLRIEREDVGGVLLKSGKHLSGKVVSDDGKRVQLEIRTNSGAKATTGVSYSQLHPRTVCELWVARTDENDLAAHQEIAEYAEANGLLVIARTHYMHIADSDPALADAANESVARLAETASASELARGRKELAKGTGRSGERVLLRLQREFPGTPAAAEAGRVLADHLETKQAAQLSSQRNKALAPIESLLNKSKMETNSGVSHADSETRALKDLRQARKHALAAEAKLDTVAKSAAGDAALTQQLADLRDQVSEHFINNQLQIAGVNFAKGNLDGAAKAVGDALERDPDNREGMALRTKIDVEMHADDDDWVWKRRRGDYPFGKRRYGSRGWDGTRAGNGGAGGGRR